ncbi:MAG: hypothetical protein GX573_21175 [Chloroflexi bacterium]|nr:hypothetical protein [Chloroflexota bacterium]
MIKMVIRLALVASILSLFAVPKLSSLAQEESEVYKPQILVCQTDTGCQYARMSGEFTETDMELTLGEENEYGENGYVVCSIGLPCAWTDQSPEDIDLVHGGDGLVDLVFEEEESEPVTDEAPIDPDVEFDLDSIQAQDVIPLAGMWTAYHQAGTLVCSGAISFDIPAGDVQSGELVVLDDGETLDLKNLDPELTSVPMKRVAPGTYHGELEVTADGQTMVMNFDEKFVDTFLGLGLIWAEVSMQGYQCRIERRFYVIYGGEDGFMLAEDPVSE